MILLQTFILILILFYWSIQPKLELWLDCIIYIDGITYVHKANVYNHVKAGGLHNWATKKFVMYS